MVHDSYTDGREKLAVFYQMPIVGVGTVKACREAVCQITHGGQIDTWFRNTAIGLAEDANKRAIDEWAFDTYDRQQYTVSPGPDMTLIGCLSSTTA